MYIDIEKLIKEVEKRPAIYNTGLTEYNERNKKKKLWEEICLSLNSSWATFSKLEKNEFGIEVRKKWDNIRDCFRRELSSQQNTSGSAPKKKKYRYFDALIFLVPFTQVTSKDNETSLEKLKTGNLSHCSGNVTQQENKPKPNKKQKTDDYQEIIRLLREGNNIMKDNVKAMQGINSTSSDDDDDKLFLLSLLPTFKDCTMEEKYFLRIEIMKTVLQYKQSRGQTNSNIKLSPSHRSDSLDHIDY